MKKAVIATGGKQYFVTEGETINVELLKDEKSKITMDALLVIDGEKITIGTPLVSGVVVSASVIEADTKQDKVISIRYKAKKRVHTVRGHRQRLATIKIDSIK